MTGQPVWGGGGSIRAVAFPQVSATLSSGTGTLHKLLRESVRFRSPGGSMWSWHCFRQFRDTLWCFKGNLKEILIFIQKTLWLTPTRDMSRMPVHHACACAGKKPGKLIKADELLRDDFLTIYILASCTVMHIEQFFFCSIVISVLGIWTVEIKGTYQGSSSLSSLFWKFT